MTVARKVVDDRAFEKNYNIEWYLGNGKIRLEFPIGNHSVRIQIAKVELAPFFIFQTMGRNAIGFLLLTCAEPWSCCRQRQPLHSM